MTLDRAFNKGRSVGPRPVVATPPKNEYVAPPTTTRYKKVATTKLAAKTEHKGLKRFRTVLAAVFFALLVMALLYSNAELTEQQGELEKLNSELVQLTGEYDYLSFEVESKASLKNVEEFAVRELGLIKSDSSKIEYIHLNSENVMMVNEEPLTGWQKMLTQNFLSIVEYLNP